METSHIATSDARDTVLTDPDSGVIGTVTLRQFRTGGIAIVAWDSVLGDRYVFINRHSARKLLRLLLDEVLSE